jgi:hypothetical protein
MARSQHIRAARTTDGVPVFHLSAFLGGRVGGDAWLLGRLTFLPSWIHQPSATVAGHSDVDSTVSTPSF